MLGEAQNGERGALADQHHVVRGPRPGILVVIVPLTLMLVHLSWPVFHNAWVSGEMSQNAGGLVRWPVLLLIPVGFSLLLAQAASELIKRIAFLRGLLPHAFTPEAKTGEPA